MEPPRKNGWRLPEWIDPPKGFNLPETVSLDSARWMKKAMLCLSGMAFLVMDVPAEPADNTPAAVNPLEEFTRPGKTKEGTTSKMPAKKLQALLRDTELIKRQGLPELTFANLELEGDLDISGVDLPVSLVFENCKFTGIFKARNTGLVALYMKGCELTQFEGDGCQIKLDLCFEKQTQVAEGIRLPNARIQGLLQMRGAKIRTSKANPISLNLSNATINDGLKVSGDDGKKSELSGKVDLGNARLGLLDFKEMVIGPITNFEGKEPEAIFANWAEIGGPLSLADIKCHGNVFFQGTAIDGAVQVDGMQVEGYGTSPMVFDDARIASNVRLGRLDIHGPASGDVVASVDEGLRLRRTAISGDLEFIDCKFKSSLLSLNADGMTCDGQVRIFGGGSVYEGEIRFQNARVNGDMHVHSGCFKRHAERGGDRYRTPNAFNAAGAGIGGSLCFANCQGDGGTMAAKDKLSIAGDVSLEGTRVTGALALGPIRFKGPSAVDLRQAQAGKLEILELQEGVAFLLDDLTYSRVSFGNRIHRQNGETPKVDLKCFCLNLLWSANGRGVPARTESSFQPQPYRQLAATMKGMGEDKVARSILTRMNRDRAAKGDLGFGLWIWYHVLGRTIRYGYEPSRAFYLSMAIVMVGGMIAFMARGRGWIVNAKDYSGDAGLKIPQCFMWSLEKFTPFLNLGMSDKWVTTSIPAGGGRGLTFFQVFLWLHVIAGWILTSLWIGAVTGLAK